MRAAAPTARTALTLFELPYGSLDMLLPCLFYLYRNAPADPFVPGERSDVVPSCKRLLVRRKGL